MKLWTWPCKVLSLLMPKIAATTAADTGPGSGALSREAADVGWEGRALPSPAFPVLEALTKPLNGREVCRLLAGEFWTVLPRHRGQHRSHLSLPIL